MRSTLPKTANQGTTGRDLAYFLRGLSRKDRAHIAGRLVKGTFPITGPFTERGAALLCHVTVYDVRKDLGRKTNGHHKPKTPSLTEHLIASTADEKVAAAKTLGVDVVWDTMILPLITSVSQTSNTAMAACAPVTNGGG